MEECYPTNNVFIVKTENHRYFAYILNNFETRIKFLSSGEIFPTEELEARVYKKYGGRILWKKSMNMIRYSFDSYVNKFEPLSDPWAYESDEDNGTWAEARQAKKRRKEAEKKYAEVKSQYPSFKRTDVVTPDEIENVLMFYQSHDSSEDTTLHDSRKYLDF